MLAILDSNAVIGLAKGECFESLRVLFEQVWVSPGVRREIVEEGGGRPGCRELQAGLGVWIQERTPSGQPGSVETPTMTREDREVLGLAAELSGILVTDDFVLRREGENLGLIVLGAVEIAVLLKQRGILLGYADTGEGGGTLLGAAEPIKREHVAVILCRALDLVK